ncbi:MAG: tautomerase family protein [Firmicutes bacterium]|nr:tautomerase family protein [Bacillota bacterium]
MPYVNLSWTVKASADEKRKLMDDITDIISTTTDTDKARIYVFIREYDKENASQPDCPVVQIDWVDLPTRTPEAKKEVATKIQEKLVEFPGVNAQRLLILFDEFPRHNTKIGL